MRKFFPGSGLPEQAQAAWRFALPLPLVGLLLSLYHVSLQYRPSLEIISCGSGAPCSGRYMLVYGFVSIPVMAAAAFLLISMLLITVRTVSVRTVQLSDGGESPPSESET